ncbi:MAG TPA: DUF4112 domain-containing protein [Vicinamibacterales bacterium]|nr:DUF4112 domain-containing protein [Vicinamibacterales bacterium]
MTDPALPALRKWAVLLDSAFQVPGTKLRFGLDPIVGLLPGAGDLVTGFFAVMILLHAVRLRIPKVVMARMVINSGLDLLAGAVPILGDLFDAGYKANLRNLTLLERHAHPGIPPERSDYLFVAGCIAVLALLAIVPLVVLWWLLSHIPAI